MNLTNRIFNLRIALFAVLLIAVGYLSPPASAEEEEWKLFLNEYTETWSGYYVNCFLEDGEYMWVGTHQYKVFKVLKETLKIVDTIDFYATDMAYDKEGNMWFVGAGLKKLVGDTLIGWDQNNYQKIGLPEPGIRHISIDSTGKFWLAMSEKGLVLFDGIKSVHFNDANAPFKKFQNTISINSLTVDKNNNIWVTAAFVSGIMKYDNKEWTVYDSTTSEIKSVPYEALAVDNNNNLWVGSTIGLYRFDGLDWELFNSNNSEIKGMVNHIAFDKDNKLWCSIGSGGLITYDGNTWQVFNQSNSSIHGNRIGSIYVDKKQNIWFQVTHDNNFGEEWKRSGINIYRKGGVILNVYDKYEYDLLPLLYPNPSYYNITISNIDSFEYYEIFDKRGIKVMSGSLSTNSINISQLTTGSYSLILRNNDVSKSTFFIKI